MTQHDKLFALYAANIAKGYQSDLALGMAKDDLKYFNSKYPTPPAQEETLDDGIWIARLEDGYRMQTVAKDRGYKIQQLIVAEFAEILVGPMTWEDEPRKVKTT